MEVKGFESDVFADAILDSEAKGPYSPYCMRCRSGAAGLKRMEPRGLHQWGCSCGATCDLREYAARRAEHQARQASEAGKLTPIERQFYFEPGGDA